MKNIHALRKFLIGTKWIKGNGIEAIIFLDGHRLLYENLNSKDARIDEYYIKSNSEMVIKWSNDNWISIVFFDKDYSVFLENDNINFQWKIINDKIENKFEPILEGNLTHKDYITLTLMVKKELELLIIKRIENANLADTLNSEIDSMYELVSKLVLGISLTKSKP